MENINRTNKVRIHYSLTTSGFFREEQKGCRKVSSATGELLYIEKRKRNLTKGMELPNQDKIRTLGGKETYKYLGILEADTVK